MSGKRPDESGDAALLRAFIKGERSAFSTLAGRHERGMLGMARGLLGGDVERARDAVQEAWVRMIKHAGTYRGEASVKTWLYRILINVCLNERGRKRVRITPAAGVHAESPSHTAEESEFAARVRRLVSDLPEDRRVIVLLCYHEEMTHEEAAETLGIPVGTLKSRLHTALTSLRASLHQEAGA